MELGLKTIGVNKFVLLNESTLLVNGSIYKGNFLPFTLSSSYLTLSR